MNEFTCSKSALAHFLLFITMFLGWSGPAMADDYLKKISAGPWNGGSIDNSANGKADFCQLSVENDAGFNILMIWAQPGLIMVIDDRDMRLKKGEYYPAEMSIDPVWQGKTSFKASSSTALTLSIFKNEKIIHALEQGSEMTIVAKGAGRWRTPLRGLSKVISVLKSCYRTEVEGKPSLIAKKAPSSAAKIVSKPKAPVARPISISLMPEKYNFAPGQKITVSFSGFPARGQDWIALSSTTHKPDEYFRMVMLEGKPHSGSHSFSGLPAGNYELRAYTNWPDAGYKIVTTASIIVAETTVTPKPPVARLGPPQNSLPLSPVSKSVPAPTVPSDPLPTQPTIAQESQWNSNFKTMYLTQRGAKIDGRYDYADGKITADIVGKEMRGWWSESDDVHNCGPESKWSGPVVLEFADDMQSFTGKFGKCAAGQTDFSGLTGDWHGSRVSGAFSTDLQTADSADIDESILPEDLTTMIGGGIFYMGRPPQFDEAGRQFHGLRQQRVVDILHRLKSLTEQSAEMAQKLYAQDGRALDIQLQWSEKLGEGPAAQRLHQNAEQLLRGDSVTAGLLQMLESLPLSERAKDEWPSDAVASYQAFRQWRALQVVVMHLGEHLAQSLALNARQAVWAESSRELQNLVQALVQSRPIQESNYQLLIREYHGLLDGLDEVAEGIETLRLADDYLMRGVLETARQKLPEWRTLSGQFTPREGMDAEMLAFMQDYGEVVARLVTVLDKRFDTFNPGASSQGDGFDENGWAKLFSLLSLVPEAHAANGSWLSRAMGALKTPLKNTAQFVSSGAESVGRGAGNCLLSPIQCMKKIHRETTNVAGGVLETTNIIGKFSIGMTADLLYGPGTTWDGKSGTERSLSTRTRLWDSFTHRINELMEDDQRMQKAFHEGRAGSAVLKEAQSQLNDFDEYVGTTSSSAVEMGTGGFGVMSWTTGGLAKITSSMVTGLGRTVLTAADPEATPGQLAMAGVDLALSSIGGSTSVIKGSQAVRLNHSHATALYRSAQNVGTKGLARMQGARRLTQQTAARKKLSQLFKGSTDDVLAKVGQKNSAQYKQLIRAEENGISALRQRSGEAISDVRQIIVKNMDNAGQNAKNFVTKKFDNSAKGVVDGMLNLMTGEGLETLAKSGAKRFMKKAVTGLLDNIVAALAENELRSLLSGSGETSLRQDTTSKTQVGTNTSRQSYASEETQSDSKATWGGDELEVIKGKDGGVIIRENEGHDPFSDMEETPWPDDSKQASHLESTVEPDPKLNNMTESQSSKKAYVVPQRKGTKGKTKGCYPYGNTNQFKGLSYSPCISLCRYYVKEGINTPVLQEPTRRQMLLNQCLVQ